MIKLQNVLESYIKNNKRHKKSIAILVALSLIISFTVPFILIEPAVSMSNEPVTLLSNTRGTDVENYAKKDDNKVYDFHSLATMKDITLLIGEGEGVSWANELTSVDDVLEAAKEQYFLGIASDFCVFIENDFTATAADAEGRVAVGGDLSFTGNWNYQIGSGDYASMTALIDTDNYTFRDALGNLILDASGNPVTIRNFAHLICGGKLSRINTMSTGKGHPSGDIGYHTANSGDEFAYTVFYDYSEDLFKRLVVGNVSASTHYTDDGNDVPYNQNCHHDYPGDCGDDCEHYWLESVNEEAQIYETELIDFSETFAWIRNQSLLLSKKKTKGTTVENNTFTAPLTAENEKVIYFDLGDEWSSSEINFWNIPENANIIVNCGAKNPSILGNITTKINGEQIHKHGGDDTNNNKNSERILYNFYNAENIEISANFNGTVLAPNADVRSNETCVGHLSGALIAKSFYGGLEFGYRPYRGSSEILGSTSGYIVPVDKLSNCFPLAGAIFNITDELNNIASVWNSSDNGTSYAQIPSAIDFSGDTCYGTPISNNITVQVNITDSESHTVNGSFEIAQGSNLAFEVRALNAYYKDVGGTTTINGTPYDGIDAVTDILEKQNTAEFIDGWHLDSDLYSYIKYSFTKEEILPFIDAESNSITFDIYYAGAEAYSEYYLVNPNAEQDDAQVQVMGIDSGKIFGEKSEELTDEQTEDTNEFNSFEQQIQSIELDANLEEPEDDGKTTVMVNISGAEGKPLNSSFKIDLNEDLNFEIRALDAYYGTNMGESNGSTTIVKNTTEIPIDFSKIVYKNGGYVGSFRENWHTDNSVYDSVKYSFTTTELASFVDALGVITFDIYYDDAQSHSEYCIVYPEGTYIPENAGVAVTTTTTITTTTTTTTTTAPRVINKEYSIVEVLPPDGYLADTNADGSERSYRVEIIEEVYESGLIDANNGGGTYPSRFDVEYKLYRKSELEPYFSRLIEVTDVYQADLIIQRTVVIKDSDGNEVANFYIERNANNGQIEVIETTIEGVKTSLYSDYIANLAKAQKFDLGGNSYYYDPMSMMVMPLPAETPTFENKPGLIFEKVDDLYDAVTGAVIKLQVGDNNGGFIDVEDTAIWSWNSDTWRKLIDVTKLSEDVIYRFHESAKPAKHEIAEDIYFKKISDTEIRYASSADDLDTENKFTTLNLLKKGIENLTIQMIDARELGAKLFLKKVDGKTQIVDPSVEPLPIHEKPVLPGATLVLYANDGTLINKWENFNGETNVFNDLASITDKKQYVENGYLKPGIYYFTEPETPVKDSYGNNAIYANPGKIYFTVNKDYTIEAGRATIIELELEKDSSNQYGVKFFPKTQNGVVLNDSNEKNKAEVIKDVIKITIRTNGVNMQHVYFDDSGKTHENVNADFFEKTFETSLDIYNLSIQSWDGDTFKSLEISYIEFLTEDGTKFIYKAAEPEPDEDVTVDENTKFYSLNVVQDSENENIAQINKTNTPTMFSIESFKVKLKTGATIKNIEIAGLVNGTFGGNSYSHTFETPVDVENFAVQANQSNAIEYIELAGTGGIQYIYVTDDFKLGLEVSGGERIVQTPNGTSMNDNNTEAISNIRKYIIIANNGIMQNVYFTNDDQGGINKKFYAFKYEAPIELKKAKAQDWNNTNLQIGYVELENSDGSKYIYMTESSDPITQPVTTISEDDTPTETTTTTVPINADINDVLEIVDNGLFIENQPQGAEIDIKVEKKWLDLNFESARPSSVEVQLYRTTEEKEVNSDYSEANKVEDGTIALDSSNKWKHTWKALDYWSDDNKTNPYYYYVKEIGTYENYTPSYSVAEDGTLTITNELKTIDLDVQKFWVNDYQCKYDHEHNNNDCEKYNVKTPASIVVKLQWQVTDNNNQLAWEDVPNVPTLKLTSAGQYRGKFDNLLEGKTYRVVETQDISYWKWVGSDSSSSSDVTLGITNKLELGELELEKIWDNDDASSRPQQINLKLYRATEFPVLPASYPEQTPEQVQQDYARLLQYSLYYYDANMCGNHVDENTAMAWREDCHTGDDVLGGFHDAGDHVMFGLPQGYSSSITGWSLYEFRKSYDDLGQTEHMKVIQDYFCDFFVQTLKTDNDGKQMLLYQKGNGQADHSVWNIPEKQYRDGSESYWTEKGSDIAAEYAAALALNYLNFGKDLPVGHPEYAKYQNYLSKAIELYDYANEKQDCEYTENGNFYSSGSWEDDRNWASVWLYLATNDTRYKDIYSGGGGSAPVDWQNVAGVAACAYAAHIDNTSEKWSSVTNAINGVIDNTSNRSPEGYYHHSEWGSTRYNTGVQMLALVANKYNKNDDYTAWCEAQMNYILGDNPAETCYVTGFAENSSKKPHYRAACGRHLPMNGVESHDALLIDGFNNNKYQLIGAVVGGPSNKAGTYYDRRSDYKCNEVAIDYNANLIAAAAGLYSAFKTGKTVIIPNDDIKTQYVQEGTVLEPTEPIDNNIEQQSLLAKRRFSSVVSNVVMSSGSGMTPVFTLDNISFGEHILQNKLTDITRVEVEFEFVATDASHGYGGRVSLSRHPTTDYNPPGYDYNGSTDSIFTIDWNPAEDIYKINISSWTYGGNLSVKQVRFYSSVFKIEPAKSSLCMGESTDLTTIGAAGAINWTMANNCGCSIDENNVLTAGNVAGECTITGVDSEGKTGAFKVNVLRMSIIEQDQSINIGDNITYTLANQPVNSTIEWSFSPNVGLSVSGNTITAIEKGKYTVTITANDNSGEYITDATTQLEVKGFEINEQNQNIAMSDSISYTFTNQPANSTIEWIFPENSGFSVDSSNPNTIIAGNATGEFEIIVVAKVSGAEIARATTTVNVHAMSISEQNMGVVAGGDITYSFANQPKNSTIEWIFPENSGLSVDSNNPNVIKAGNTSGAFEITANAKKNSVIVATAKTTLTVSDFIIDPTEILMFVDTTEIIEFNANITSWSSDNEFVDLSYDSSTMKLTVKAKKYSKTPVIVNVVRGGVTYEIEVTITANLSVETPIKIHVGGTLDIIATPDDNVTFSMNQEENEPIIATIENGKVIGAAIGTASFTATRNSQTANGIIEVIDDLEIVGNNLMELGKTQSLSVENAVGYVKWTSDDPSILTINSRGKVIPVNFGITTVTATDIDGSKATFKINVMAKGVVPTLPTDDPDFKFVMDITLNAQDLQGNNRWVEEISNLPIISPTWKPYFYYIVEVDDNGQPITTLNGNDAIYHPVAYKNNGSQLDSNDTLTLSVTNRKTDKKEGTMPSAGGEGTKAFHIGGGILILSAAAYCFIKRLKVVE